MINILRRTVSTMAPISKVDYLVIGGGSGGVATARRAAQYGAKVAIIEGDRLGGTCVNRGCVPKKVMWNAADVRTRLSHAPEYGTPIGEIPEFDWAGFKAKRDAYVERLNGIYERNLAKEDVKYVKGWANFVDGDAHTVKVSLPDGNSETIYGEHVVIATGGRPHTGLDVPGKELGIDSDGFFLLEKQPKSVAIVGAGYIGVELAGVLHALGSESHIFLRGDKLLRQFDSVIGDTVTELYEKEGVHVHKGELPTKVEKTDKGLLITYSGGKDIVVDTLIWAIGREPFFYTLNVDSAGIKRDPKGKIVVDEFQNTNLPKVYSLGDVAEAIELTPAAIAAGRKLGDRLFGGKPNSKQDYENIPSAVFSHPEAASTGITEDKAREIYGDSVKIYQSRFINMYWSPLTKKSPSVYKVVCAGPSEKVVGVHIVGENASEIMQGFGVAVKMGATKEDLDSCVAIHPTAAEELVTLK